MRAGAERDAATRDADGLCASCAMPSQNARVRRVLSGPDLVPTIRASCG